MTPKSNYLERELNFIQNEEIKKEVTELVEKLPDYFFKVPASSTGKYHPNYALGFGGLLRHTQVAVRTAEELMRLEMFKPLQEDKDFIIGALILHDGLKHGDVESRYTKANHPVLMSDFIRANCKNEQIANKLAGLVLTHMGQWNTEWNSTEEIMPKPSTKTENFVHLCDYIASRKQFEFNFEV